MSGSACLAKPRPPPLCRSLCLLVVFVTCSVCVCVCVALRVWSYGLPGRRAASMHRRLCDVKRCDVEYGTRKPARDGTERCNGRRGERHGGQRDVCARTRARCTECRVVAVWCRARQCVRRTWLIRASVRAARRATWSLFDLVFGAIIAKILARLRTIPAFFVLPWRDGEAEAQVEFIAIPGRNAMVRSRTGPRRSAARGSTATSHKPRPRPDATRHPHSAQVRSGRSTWAVLPCPGVPLRTLRGRCRALFQLALPRSLWRIWPPFQFPRRGLQMWQTIGEEHKIRICSRHFEAFTQGADACGGGPG